MNHIIWNELGLLHFNAGAYAQSINAYQHAIQSNAHFLPARLNLARAYFRNGNLLQAEKTYQNSLAFETQEALQADIWMQLGQFYSQTGRHNEAQVAFERAEALQSPIHAETDSSGKSGTIEDKIEAPVDIEMDTASIEAAAPEPIPFAEIKLENIYINPRQPRMRINVDDLVESIREHGVLQPILVSPNGDKDHYILVSGHRRLEASRQVGLETIPALIRKVDERERLELALTENTQRLNLSSFEEADAYAQLGDKFGLTPEEIARRMGKSSVAINDLLQQLTLPERIKRALDFERIQPGHARALLKLHDPSKQMNAFEQILQHDLSVRKTEALVRLLQLELEHETEEMDAPEESSEETLISQENEIKTDVELEDQLQEEINETSMSTDMAVAEAVAVEQERAFQEKNRDLLLEAGEKVDISNTDEPPVEVSTSSSPSFQTPADDDDDIFLEFTSPDEYEVEPDKLEHENLRDTMENDVHLKILAGENVVKQNPANEEAWKQLAENYAALNQTEKAIQAYQKALSLAPHKVLYYEKLGQLSIDAGSYAEAADFFEQALAIDEESIYLHCALASSYKRQGLNDEAQSHINLVLPTIDQESPYNRACFESICGNLEAAIELLDIAMEADSTLTVEKIKNDQDFDFIRDDKRFSDFLNQKLFSPVD